jgi:hypothetical protein
VGFQSVEQGGLISLLFPVPYGEAILTFFYLCIGFIPHMQTPLVSFEAAAEEAAGAIPLKDCSATSTCYAIAVSLPSEVLTCAHEKSIIAKAVFAGGFSVG